MTYATLSTKGQITLPVKFLRGLGLKPKDRIEIESSDGVLHLRKAADFFALKGSLKGLRTQDERKAMQKAVADHVLGRKA